MKILLVNHYAGSPQYGMEQRPFYLAREWVRAGHEVTIVGATYSHLRSVQPKRTTFEKPEVVDGIRYVWLDTPAYAGNGVGRVRNMATFVAKLWTLVPTLTRWAPDAVIASSTYPLDVFPTWAVARATGARFVFEVHDLWPLSPQILGKLPKWHPFIATMQVGEDFAYRAADAVVSLLPCAEAHMRAHGLAPGKFHAIPNGIVREEWAKPLGEPLRAPLVQWLGERRSAGDLIVGYTGALGPANAMDLFLDAAEKLSGEPIAFLLVGEGPDREALVRRAEKLPRVRWFPPVPKRFIPAVLSGIDVGYVGAQSGPLHRYGVSMNKLFDYMMAGIPIVSALDAGNDPVAEAGAGLSVRSCTATDVARAFTTLARMTADERRALGECGRKHVLAHHDYAVLARKFLDVLREGRALRRSNDATEFVY